MKRVEVEGDVLEFPNEVTDEQIDREVKKHLKIQPKVDLPDPNPLLKETNKAISEGFKKQLDAIKAAGVAMKAADLTPHLDAIREAIRSIPKQDDKNMVAWMAKISAQISAIKPADTRALEKKIDDLSAKIDKLINAVSSEKVIVRDKDGRPIGVKVKNGR